MPKVTRIGNQVQGGSTAASAFVTKLGDDKDIEFRAVQTGTAGDSISVRYVVPGSSSAALGVTVSGNDITVNLATDGDGDPSSTAAQIAAAVNASTPAKALVTAKLPYQSAGAGVPGAVAKTNLTKGSTHTSGTGTSNWRVSRPKPRTQKY